MPRRGLWAVLASATKQLANATPKAKATLSPLSHSSLNNTNNNNNNQSSSFINPESLTHKKHKRIRFRPLNHSISPSYQTYRGDNSTAPHAADEAETLVAHACGLDAASELYYKMPNRAVLSANQKARIKRLVEERVKGVPIAYLVGRRHFWDLEFLVNESVLIPRADSEVLVETSVELLSHMSDENLNSQRNDGRQSIKSQRVLDLGTGSGCLILSILHSCPTTIGVAVDLSLSALNVAQRNAAHNKIGVHRCEWVNLNFAQLASSNKVAAFGPFDLIVTNPPYIREDEMIGLERQVRDYEPNMALTSGPLGLECYEQIAVACGAASERLLSANGRIVVEAGFGQATDITALFENRGFVLQEIRKDYGDVDRCLVFAKAVEV